MTTPRVLDVRFRHLRGTYPEVKARGQAGFTLLEAIVAAGILAIAVVGFLLALSSFGHVVASQSSPQRAAAADLANQTLWIAQDAWKYGSPGAMPNGAQSVSLPLNQVTAVPATLTTTAALSGTSAAITVTVTYSPDPRHKGDPGTVGVSGSVMEQAPQPGSVLSGGSIPQPSGAP